jgi:hypothetical protein
MMLYSGYPEEIEKCRSAVDRLDTYPVYGSAFLMRVTTDLTPQATASLGAPSGAT